MKHREIIKLLEADGWRHVRTSGSHAIYKHEQKAGNWDGVGILSRQV